MFLSKLKQVYLENKDKNKLYVRSLLKEAIQYYVLNFVFTGNWGKILLFKGGTALRFCFKLPRLSEDLDFDVEVGSNFNIEDFSDALKNYFSERLKFDDLSVKLANNRRTIYLKFPILKEIGLPVDQSETNILHIRIDFSQNDKPYARVEVTAKSYENLSFVMRRYSIEDLFAGKISAILTREKIEGVENVVRFKGRDYYDLIWYLEKGIKPNWVQVENQTGLSKVKAIKLINQKIKKVTKEMIEDDLTPFIEERESVMSFAGNFQELAKEYLKNL